MFNAFFYFHLNAQMKHMIHCIQLKVLQFSFHPTLIIAFIAIFDYYFNIQNFTCIPITIAPVKQ